MAATVMPGVVLMMRLATPWHMKPAPRMPTRIGLPCSARAPNAVSTINMPLSCEAERGDALLDRRFRSLEAVVVPVLLRDERDRQRPRKSEARIGVVQTALGARGVELSDLIAHVGLVAQRLVAVREPLRHVQPGEVVLGELHRDVLEIRRALRPQIDDDVDDRAAGTANELRLGHRGELKVHPANRSLARVRSDIRLRDERLQPVFGEFLLTERASEEPAFVAERRHVDQERAFQFRFGEDHHASKIADWNAARLCKGLAIATPVHPLPVGTKTPRKQTLFASSGYIPAAKPAAGPRPSLG